MKKINLFFLVHLVIINLSFSQSPFSILGKAGGQLLQDLSKKDEWRSIGKAIETAGNMTYEMEKINARNKQEITIRINPDNIKRGYPAEGYKWKNPDDLDDYSVEKIGYIDREKKDNAYELYEKGCKYFEKGDWDNALNLFSQSIEIMPTPFAYYLRGVLYNYNGRYEKALENIGVIFNYDVSPEYFILFYKAKAFIVQNMGKPQEAITLFTKALNLHEKYSSDISGNCIILNYIGRLKNDLGDYQDAINDFNKSIEMCPNDYDGYFSRALSKASYKDYKGALSDFDIALSLMPNEDLLPKFILFVTKAGIYFELNNYKETIQYANGAIEMYDDNNMSLSQLYSTCYYLRGKAKIELKINVSGCSDIKKAIKLGMNIDDRYYNEHCK